MDIGTGVQEQQSTPQAPRILGLTEIVTAVKEVSKVADKRASTFLLALGATVLVLALLFKVKLFGLTVAEIQPSEFIAVLVVCLACLLSGAYVRMLQERVTNDHELRMLEAALRYSAGSQGATLAAIGEAQDAAEQSARKALARTTKRKDGG